MPLDLTQLYDAHASALYAFLLNLTRCEGDTRDVLQEIFLRIARNPNLLAGARDPRAFLLRLAHNQAIDSMRRRTSYSGAIERLSQEPAEIFVPAPSEEIDAFRVAVTGALADLPEEQRAIVHLKLWENMTFAQIAETLAIPQNTAASRYRYALDKLRTLLRPICEP
jgi:RNA polymerase sigma-70 factor (ECF subfamily)